MLNDRRISWLPRVYGELDLNFLAIGSYPDIVIIGRDTPYDIVNEEKLAIHRAGVARSFLGIPTTCGVSFYDSDSILISLMLSNLRWTQEEFAQAVFNWVRVALSQAGINIIQEDGDGGFLIDDRYVSAFYILNTQPGFYYTGGVIYLNINYSINAALLNLPYTMEDKLIGINQSGFTITVEDILMRLESNFTRYLGETLVLTPISVIETRLNALHTIYSTEKWIKDATYPV